MKIKSISPNHKHFESICQQLCRWIHGKYDYFAYLQIKWDLIEQYKNAKGKNHKQFRSVFLPKIFIATDKAKLVGFCRLVSHVIEDRKDLSPWISQVYVFEPFRKKGYASAMINAVCQEAEKLHYKSIYIRTDDQEEFYKKLAWQTFDQQSENEVNYKLMRKTI
jgi:GNAT superfamily N-acetyltransferase